MGARGVEARHQVHSHARPLNPSLGFRRACDGFGGIRRSCNGQIYNRSWGGRCRLSRREEERVEGGWM
jgi:hypothetical protein